MRVVSFMTDIIPGAIDAVSDHSKWIQSLPEHKYDPNWINKMPWQKASNTLQSSIQSDILKIDAINTLSKPGVYMPGGEVGYNSALLKDKGNNLSFMRKVGMPLPDAISTTIPQIDKPYYKSIVSEQRAHTHPYIVNNVNLMNVPRAPSTTDIQTQNSVKDISSMNPDMLYTLEGNKPTVYQYGTMQPSNNMSRDITALKDNEYQVYNKHGQPIQSPDILRSVYERRTSLLKRASDPNNPSKWLNYTKLGGLSDSNIPIAGSPPSEMYHVGHPNEN